MNCFLELVGQRYSVKNVLRKVKHVFRGFFLIKLIVWLFPFIFLFSKLFLQKQTFTSVHQRTSAKNFAKVIYSSSSIKLQASTLYWKDYIIGFFLWILKKLQFFVENRRVNVFLLGIYQISPVLLKQLQHFSYYTCPYAPLPKQ